MPTRRKPRSGSLQFWPRKRAKRMYPRISKYPSIDEIELDRPKLLGFAGYKAGMLHIIMKDTIKGSPTFGQDISVPVTVFDCPPLFVVAVRVYKNSPYGLSVITEAWVDKRPKGLVLGKISKPKKSNKNNSSTQFAKMRKNIDDISNIRLVVATQPKLAGFGKKKSDIFEIEVIGKSVEDKLKFSEDILGNTVSPSDVLREGELVDTIAVTKGYGTQGPVKRFGIVIQGPGAKGKRRHVGSLGQESPGKVRWSVPQAGQTGLHRRTEYNKRILQINESENAGDDITPSSGFKHYGKINGSYLLVKGSVPGTRKRLVIFRTPIRVATHKFLKPEIKEIVK